MSSQAQFTQVERARLRDELVAAARADARISGAAVTGSGAAGQTDQWSDVDLALSVETDLTGVVADWTGRMYAAWLYALHARSSLARGRVWQAEFVISAMRDQVLALACVRHGLPAGAARGVDGLPAPALAAVAGGLACSLDPGELRRAFGVVTEALLDAVLQVDPALAGRLAGPLRELAG